MLVHSPWSSTLLHDLTLDCGDLFSPQQGKCIDNVFLTLELILYLYNFSEQANNDAAKIIHFIIGIPENLASFNIQFGGPTTTINEVDTTPLTSPLQEEEANKIVDLVNDVVGGELDVGTTTEVDVDNDGEPDYQYEYVYYYYDENGVNGTLIDVKPANSLTKFQNISAIDIHTNSGKI